MKTVILYRSKHHGNTLKVVQALADHFEDIDLIDIEKLCKHEIPDLSSYHLIGLASGIYYGECDRDLKRIAQEALRPGDKCFGIMTYGGADKWHGRDLDGICRMRQADLLTSFGCPGFDTWGPFKIVGGVQKGHPDDEDIQRAIDFYQKLLDDYGAILEDDWKKRTRQRAWEAAHPAGGVVQLVKNTVNSVKRRRAGKSTSEQRPSAQDASPEDVPAGPGDEA